MSEKSAGRFTFILHAHLPYVLNHGKWPHGVDWLSEAAAETYIPILNALFDLLADGYQPKLTIDISPVLAEQLSDPVFKSEFSGYLDQKIQAAEVDIGEFQKYGDSEYEALAVFWRDFYTQTKIQFEKRYEGDLIRGFRELREAGVLDIMTCGATHGYFPLLSHDGSIGAQVKTAVHVHNKHFKSSPRGIWLPECAYRPAYPWIPPVTSVLGKSEMPRRGVEDFLSENGLEYFIIDSALLKGGVTIGVYMERFTALQKLWEQFEKKTQYRPEDNEKSPYDLYLLNPSHGGKPVTVFARDPRTGLQVWSGEWGYPGDGWYLEFHKKRFPGGHRYWRITTSHRDLADKMLYNRNMAMRRIETHADHFVKLVKTILKEKLISTKQPGIVAAPYDAELFGHWWFEGVDFLKLTLRKMCEDPEMMLTFASEAVDSIKPTRVVTLPEGSWGQGGHHYIWLNSDTEWTWEHIYEDEARMKKLLDRYEKNHDPLFQRILKQAGRELLLLQASDWQFLISTFAARDYAEMRFGEHHTIFQKLADIANKVSDGGELSSGEARFLEDSETRDALFSDIDPNWFREPKR
jgi:1,4-alpha-glucan branching enzyme